jgi:hypothetical protein
MFSLNPTQIHAQAFVNPSTCNIKRFVAKRLDHAEQLRLGSFTRLLGDKTDNPWHLDLNPLLKLFL